MKCRFITSIIVIAYAGIAYGTGEPAGGETLTAEGVKFDTGHLNNGMRVSIYEDSSMPVATVRLVYSIGSAHEEDHSRGLAHLFEHLMFSATKNYPERAVYKYVEQFGGSTNATTSFDQTNYFAEIPPDRIPRILEIYADRMVNLVLNEEVLQKDKKIVLEELRVRSQNDPIQRLTYTALQVGFGDHPYAISPLGTEVDVNNATLESCLEFYSTYYGPRNAHLIVVGAVNTDDTWAMVQESFGSIEKPVSQPPEIPLIRDWSFPERIFLKEDIPPVEAAGLIFALPSAKSDEYEATNVMISLLEGIDGFDDVLVRERKKALYAQLIRLDAKAGRVLGFGSVALPYRSENAAYGYIEETIKDLANFGWLTDDSLDAVKRRYLRSEYSSRYISSLMASRIDFAHGWQDDIGLAFGREEIISRISREDVERVFRKYIVEGTATRLYVEPVDVPWYVTMFGRLYPLASRLGFTGFAL